MQGPPTPRESSPAAVPKGYVSLGNVVMRRAGLFDTSEFLAGASFAACSIGSIALGVAAAGASVMLTSKFHVAVEAAVIVGCLTIIPCVAMTLIGGLVIPYMGSGAYFGNAQKSFAAVCENAHRIAIDPSSNTIERVAVVTGSSGGLGLVNAAWLIASGYTVVFACRNQQRAETAMKEASKLAEGYRTIIAKSGKKLLPLQPPVFVPLVLDTLAGVTSFVSAFKTWMAATNADLVPTRPRRLEIFVNNAGVAEVSFGGYNSDGIECVMATNHVAPYLLSKLIVKDILVTQYQKLGPANPNGEEVCRFVSVSSIMHATTPLDFTTTRKKGAVNDTLRHILDVCYKPANETDSPRPILKVVKNMYGISKFGNISLGKIIPRWFDDELSAREITTNDNAATTKARPFVSSVVVHPGAVGTDIFRNQRGPTKRLLRFALSFNIMKTPEQGACTQVWASTLVHKEGEGMAESVGSPLPNFRGAGNGRFVSDCHDGHATVLSLAAQEDEVHRIVQEETDKVLLTKLQ